MFQKRKTFRLAALKRIAEMGVPAGTKRTNTKKALLNFSRKIAVPQGRALGRFPQKAKSLLQNKAQEKLEKLTQGVFQMARRAIRQRTDVLWPTIQ